MLWRKLGLALLTALLVTLALCAANAETSGTWGTCFWTLDGNGVLTVQAGTAGSASAAPWKSRNTTRIVFKNTVVLPKSCDGLFSEQSDLKSIDLTGVDTSGVTDMSRMFFSCESLTTLDVSGFDTSAVTDMSRMFNGCDSLTALDVSGFDTSAVTTMDHMFDGCSSLTTLDVSGFDTSSVTNMGTMFSWCKSLTTLDVSGFDTSAVTDMSVMFQECSSLTTLDVSGFDTSAVTDMGFMFSGCSSLRRITLGNKFSFMGNRQYVLCTLPDGHKWHSKQAGKWFTAVEIAQDRSGIPDTYKSTGPITLDTNKGVEITGFRYVYGSLIPTTSATKDLYSSTIFMSIDAEDLDDNSTHPLTITLPAGFSFSFNEVQRTKTFDIITRQGILSTPIYPLYSDTQPKTVTFKASGAFNLSKGYPVTSPATATTIYAQQGIKENFTKKAAPSYGLWSRSNLRGTYNADLAWLCDMLAFPDGTVRDNPAAATRDDTIVNLQNLGFMDIKREMLDSGDPAGLECYFAVRSIIENGNVRHVVAMVNIGQYDTAQWIGNFTVYGIKHNWGIDTSTHYGFQEMGSKLEGKLKAYLEQHNIMPEITDVFVTGHSRAAAASTIVVHDRNIGASNDVVNRLAGAVAYGFATPSTTQNPTADGNIHNFLYYHDIVCYVPNWSGYGKYGRTYVFGLNASSPKNDEILSLLWGPINAGGMTLDFTIDSISGLRKLIESVCDTLEQGIRAYGLSSNAGISSNATYHASLIENVVAAHVNYLHPGLFKSPSETTYEEAARKQFMRAQGNFATIGARLVYKSTMDNIRYAVDVTKETVAYLWKEMLGGLTGVSRVDRVSIFCPVNATFVTPEGDVLAKFENHELVECDEDRVLAWSEGDGSVVLIDGDVDYQVQIAGNDIGAMDIVATTLEKDAEAVGTFAREALPVYKGEAYQLNAVQTETADEMTIESLTQIVAQGMMDDGFMWTLYESGRLTVAGTGAMPDYTPQTAPDFDGKTFTVVEFGDKVESIGANLFAKCADWPSGVGITGIHVPLSVKTVGENAFEACDELQTVIYEASAALKREIQLADGNSPILSAAWQCDNRRILKDIEGWNKLVLPEGVETISEDAFKGSAAQAVIVPNACAIKEGAFVECPNLVFIIVPKGMTVPEAAYDNQSVEIVER